VTHRSYWSHRSHLLPGNQVYLSANGHVGKRCITYLKVPISFDMALADDFPVAVDEVEFTEFVVLIFEIDGPIATSGGGGIGAPGRPGYLGEFGIFVCFYREGNRALLSDHRSRFRRLSLAASQDQEREEKE
jgi:hypothetical protein